MAIKSLVRLSDLSNLRLDPEYYQPSNLDLAVKLATLEAVPIFYFANVTDGIHSSPDFVTEGGITYLSAKSVKDNYFILTDAGQISQEQNRLNPRTQARINDVLLTTVGTIGNAAVVYKDILPANMDRHLGIIRIRKDSDVDPYYLATFLNSKFGRFQTLREATGNVQLNLFVGSIKRLLVPIGERFNKIGQLTRQAYDKLLTSEPLYSEAEAEMLERLEWHELSKHPVELYSIQKFLELEKAERMDSEHFQPQFKRLQSHLQKKGAKRLKEFSPLVKRGIQPKFVKDGEILVLDSKSIRPQGIEPSPDERTNLKFYLSSSVSRAHVQKGDVLLNSTGRGTIGRASCYQLDHLAIADNHVAIIRPNNRVCLPIYLSLFLNSPAGIAQSEMYQTGSSGQLEIYSHHISQFLVYLPKNDKGEIDLKWQEKLVEKVTFAAQVKSEALADLEKARHLVETEIEAILLSEAV